MPSRSLRALSVCLVLLAFVTMNPRADTATQPVPFAQDWTNTALIAVSDDWSGVPGIVGYRGDGLTSTTGVDPQTVTADFSGAAPVVDVNVNQTTPNTFGTGGVAEFEITNPVVALQGSGTARAPSLVITVSTLSLASIQISYNLRDIDGSADNAVQPVALQYRVGTSGSYTNVPAAFVADASSGPSLATLVTAVNVSLPAEVTNQPVVQFRIITADAVGNDEWIGIDDLSITGSVVAEPTNPTGVGSAAPASLLAGSSTLLSVLVTPGSNPASSGLAVTADLTAIDGGAAQAFYDDQTHGDAVAGDNRFSYTATVPAGLGAGAKEIVATISDAQSRSTTATFGLTVTVPAPRGVVISQIFGGGGNSGAPFANDYIELYNTTASAVSLAGWSVQYASASGSTWQVTTLTGAIAPAGYYLVKEGGGANAAAALPPPDATGGIAMAGSAGKVALASDSTPLTGTCPKAGVSVADFVGYGGTANCFEGATPTGTLSNSTAALRKNDGAQDTDDNGQDFTVGAPNPRNSSGNVPTGIGAANPQAIAADGVMQTLLTVRVTPGTHPTDTDITVVADLSAIGGSATASLVDDGSGSDALAHDSVFSLATPAAISTTVGQKTIVATISDSVLTDGVRRHSTANIPLTIETTPTAIHDIQGDGSRSSLAGQFLTTRGIVTALKFNGVFIQTADAQVDGSDLTSEGLFVFTSARPPAFLAVGDDVSVSGTLQEFVPAADPESPPLTELGFAAFRVVTPGQPLPAPVDLLPAYTSPSGGFEQLERFEGMRIRATITAIAPTEGSVDEATARSSSNGNFHAVIQSVPRPLREPGLEPTQVLPDGAPASVPRFDGNPERLRVDSDALLGAEKIEVVAGQTIEALTGVLDYAFRSYMILPDPADEHGAAWAPSGNASATPVPLPDANEFTVGHFNLERLFDDVDDPAFSASNEPVLTPSALDDRLKKASLAIRHVLRAPDVLGVVEVENLAVLQRLAARISSDAIADGEPDPQYFAYLEPGNDVGSIDVGFLVKRPAERVHVVAVTQVGKDATYVPPTSADCGAAGASPCPLLNDRPSLVLEAEITGPSGVPYPITVIVNHLRSLSGIDGADGDRIRAKRRAQAEFLANYIQSRQAARPLERIVSVGDYNAFQFSDGYVDVMGTIKGTPAAAADVVLASSDLVTPDLTNVVELLGRDQRYSFSFDGNAQAIDHILVNDPMRRRFTRMAYARLDADFPESLRNDPTRPERISDHDAAIGYFALPGAPVVTLNGATPMTVEAYTTFTDPGAVAVDAGATPDQDRPLAVSVSGSVDSNQPGTYTLTYSATNGFFTTTIERTVIVADRIAPAISGFSVTPSTIGPPDHRMVDVAVSYVATDASGLPTCSASAASSERVNGLGDGDTAPDWLILDAHHVQLRAERAGAGSGRVYTVTVRCTDPSGNTGIASGTVTVPR